MVALGFFVIVDLTSCLLCHDVLRAAALPSVIAFYSLIVTAKVAALLATAGEVERFLAFLDALRAAALLAFFPDGRIVNQPTNQPTYHTQETPTATVAMHLCISSVDRGC